MSVKEGLPAPEFEIETHRARKVSPADFAGRWLVVYFYPKDDTPGCTQEAIAFTEKADAFAARNASILGISPDPVARHEKFAAKHGLSVELGSDTDQSVASAFGVWVEKSMYGRTYMGVERSTFLIDPEGKVARIWRKVKVKGHADEVLSALA